MKKTLRVVLRRCSPPPPAVGIEFQKRPALVIELVFPGSRIRVLARSATCIYVMIHIARGLVLVCSEC